MKWTEVTIFTTTEGADAMAEVLFSTGVAGVSIEDPADIALYQRPSEEWDFIDESIFADHGSVVYVKGYVAEEDAKKVQAIRERAAAIASIRDAGMDFGSGEVAVRTVMDEDWAENWKQYYHPFTVGDTLAVTPCWTPYESPGRIVVRLEPGAAFGTGQHETTFMCLLLAEKTVKTGDRVLDIGCGTGILGIASVCLGAASASLIDRDEVAVSAARHNAQLNTVTNKVHIAKGNLADGILDRYEVIFANIVADVIIGLLPDIPRLLTPQASFIASGIIKEREGDVIEAARQNGFIAEEHIQSGEWVALLLRVQS